MILVSIKEGEEMKKEIKSWIGINEIEENKGYLFCKVFLTFIFAMTVFLDSILSFSGYIYSQLDEIYFSKIGIGNVLLLIGTWIVSFLFVSILEKLLPKIEKTLKNKKERKTKKIKIFFVVTLVLLIFWLPYILSYFPGGIYADTATTIDQALGNVDFNNHNPILYALIMRVFLKIGMRFQSLQLGIELFTLFQIIIMAITIAYFIYWLYKKGVSTKYLLLFTIFFSICRLIPMYAISLWKDTPFCIALFWYIIFIAETIYQNGKNIEKISGVITYIILILLVAFLRNNGIYIIVPTTFFILIIYRKNITKSLKKFVVMSILVIFLTLYIQGPVYKKYGMSTEFVENLGVPLQQICYVVAKEGNLTEKQKDFINQLCPIEIIEERYAPCIVDRIKWDKNFSDEFLENNKGEFLKVWFGIFLQNPFSYVKAYLLNTIGFWDVKQATMDGYVNPEMWGGNEEFSGAKQTDYIQKITGKSIRNILKPSTAISPVIYLFILLFSALITIYKKRYKNLLIYLPAFLTWVTIMIAVPLAFSLRYVYILLLMVPFSIVIPFLNNKEQSEKI